MACVTRVNSKWLCRAGIKTVGVDAIARKRVQHGGIDNRASHSAGGETASRAEVFSSDITHYAKQGIAACKRNRAVVHQLRGVARRKLIVEHASAHTDYGPAGAKHIPGQAGARGKVVLVCPGNLVEHAA